MDNECECDVIVNIFQKAIKRKGLTKEQVRSINKEMLEEVRKKYKYWDNKLAEDMQDPKLKRYLRKKIKYTKICEN